MYIFWWYNDRMENQIHYFSLFIVIIITIMIKLKNRNLMEKSIHYLIDNRVKTMFVYWIPIASNNVILSTL